MTIVLIITIKYVIKISEKIEIRMYTFILFCELHMVLLFDEFIKYN